MRGPKDRFQSSNGFECHQIESGRERRKVGVALNMQAFRVRMENSHFFACAQNDAIDKAHFYPPGFSHLLALLQQFCWYTMKGPEILFFSSDVHIVNIHIGTIMESPRRTTAVEISPR